MQIVREKAYARAGLIGNPSDGYHGKTISLSVKNFQTDVVLYEWPDLEILWSENDRNRFGSIHQLVHDVKLHGYYGGIRLVKATIKRFAEYCLNYQYPLHDRNFSIRYQSNIPRQVGLAGSSAIIVATLRALMKFYDVSIPLHLQPSLVLSVEMGELGITAGLQDRVIQCYEGLVNMDFSKESMQREDGLEYGVYQSMESKLLDHLYIAYGTEESEPTETTHAPLRVQYDQGVPEIHVAMQQFAELTTEAKQALEDADLSRLAQLIDANFDLRASICDLSPSHLKMIECARLVGASAKFAGSGGAIIGTFQDQTMFENLLAAFRKLDCEVFQPVVY